MSAGRVVQAPIFGENAFRKNDQSCEAKWTVIANGKAIANGTTIRRNGKVSVSIVTPQKIGEGCTKHQVDSASTKDSVKGDDASATEVTRDVNGCHKALQQSNSKTRPTLKVNTSGARASTEALTSVIQQLRWRESKTNHKTGVCADLYWHGLGFDESVYNKPGVYAVNKLPGMFEIAQKIHLSRIIKRMQALFPGEFDFYPQTWFLPDQFHQFLAEVTMKNKAKQTAKTKLFTATERANNARPTSPLKLRKEHSTYIVKPDTGSQGEGIYLVQDPRDVQKLVGMKPAVVQKYIDDPLLIDGYKFDLRLYVVVSRLKPIEIYLCKDGLARFCTVEYQPPNPYNIHNTFMHLTNYSLNKFSESFVYTNAENTGSKRTYRSVMQTLKKQGCDVEKIRKQIEDLVVKTILSMLPDVTIWEHVTNQSQLVRSFQILGFDVLLSSDLKAHLLEVNSSPSLGIDGECETEEGILETVTSAVDEQIKVPLLRDSLRLIAYGENEIIMEKSCLERIYPRCQKNVSHGQVQHHHFQNNRAVITPRRHIAKNTSHRDGNIRTNSLKLGRQQKDYGDHQAFDATSHPKYSTSNVVFEEDIPLTSRSLPAKYDSSSGRKSRNCSFTNPLAQSVPKIRLHQEVKRSKAFTVVKYRQGDLMVYLRSMHAYAEILRIFSVEVTQLRLLCAQEYAISTDEWKLNEPRHKYWTASTPRSRTSQNTETAKSLPPLQKAKKTEEGHTVTDVDLYRSLPRCQICGSFVSGAGPGLYYAQQEYRSVQDKFRSEKPQSKMSPLHRTDKFQLNERPDVLSENDILPDWESDVIPFRRNLPLRSIYFEKVEKEIDSDLLRYKEWFDKSSHDETQKVPETEETSTDLHVCTQCSDVASVTSVSDDVERQHASFTYRHKHQKKICKSTAIVKSKPPAFAMREVMLLNRAAAVFIYFNGIKPSLRISATAFRNMARRCRLAEQGAMPSIDILFIDVMRQWQVYSSGRSSPFYDSFRTRNPVTSHQPSGLPFQGFLEALFRIAATRFHGETLKEKLEALVSNCEIYIREASRARKTARKKETPRTEKRVYESPRISGSFSQRDPFI